MKKLLAGLVAVAFVSLSTAVLAQDKKEEGKSEKAATGAAKSEKAGATKSTDAQKSTGTEKSAQKKKKKESC